MSERAPVTISTGVMKMEFSFGKKIKELRFAKDVTQDQLAQHLMISPQAVSKWEREAGYPDIMMLPRIAAFFDVTVDELLGTGEEIRRGKIEKWEKETEEYWRTGQMEKNLALWKSAYSEYPNDPDVVYNYMYALNVLWRVDKDPSKKEKFFELAEWLLQKGPNEDLRNSARQVLCFANLLLGDNEKARKYAEEAGGYESAFLLSHVLEGEERIEHGQVLILQLITDAANQIDRIADSYPHNEAIEIWKYVIGLYKGLFSKGDFGFYYLRMNEYSGRLSRRYAMNGEREQCLEELKNSVEYLKAFLEWAKGSEKEKHTSLLLNRLEMTRRYTNTSGRPMSTQTMEDIKRQCYDPYREDPEFIRIKSELEAIHNEEINK